MIFHRLRVISFSKHLISKVSSKKIPDVKENTRDVPKEPDNQDVKENEITVQDMKKTANKCVKNSTIALKPLPLKPCLEFKSKSEIFSPPLKTLKSYAKRKTLSMSNLKERLISMRHSNRIKQNDLPVRACAKKENISKKHDTKVLYFAESSRCPTRRRSREGHIKSDVSSTYDLFGFYKNQRHFDPYIYQKHSKDDNLLQKLRHRSAKKRKRLREAKKATNECPYTQHALKVITCKSISTSSTRMRTEPFNYNLLCFPKRSKSNLYQNQTLRLYRIKPIDRHSVDDRYSDSRRRYSVNTVMPCTMEKVSRAQSISLARLKTPAALVDTAVSTCKCVKPSADKVLGGILKSSVSCKIPKISGSYKCPESFESRKIAKSTAPSRIRCRDSKRFNRLIQMSIFSKVLQKCLSGYNAATRKPLTRSIFKHILISMVVTAMSPCICAVGIGWVISYPLRPQHVLNVYKNETLKCNEDCFKNQSQYDCWTALMSLTKRIAKATIVSGTTIVSLLRSKKDNNFEPKHLPRCRSHPYPGKRYILSHAEGRGWVIKPVRSQQRDHPKKTRFMQKFHNMLCNVTYQQNSRSYGFGYRPKVASKTNNHHTIKTKEVEESFKKTCQCADARHQQFTKSENKTSPTPKNIKSQRYFNTCAQPENITVYKANHCVFNDTDPTCCKNHIHKESFQNTEKAKPQATKGAGPDDAIVSSCNCPIHRSSKQTHQSSKESKSGDAQLPTTIRPLNKSTQEIYKREPVKKSFSWKHEDPEDTGLGEKPDHIHLSPRNISKSVPPSEPPHLISPQPTKSSLAHPKTPITSCGCPSRVLPSLKSVRSVVPKRSRSTMSFQRPDPELHLSPQNISKSVPPSEPPHLISPQPTKSSLAHPKTPITSCGCPSRVLPSLKSVRSVVPKRSRSTMSFQRPDPELHLSPKNISKSERPSEPPHIITPQPTKSSLAHPKTPIKSCGCSSRVLRSLKSVRTMVPKRSRSTMSFQRPDPELEHGNRLRSQSVSRPKEYPGQQRRRASKPYRIGRKTITDKGKPVNDKGEPINDKDKPVTDKDEPVADGGKPKTPNWRCHCPKKLVSVDTRKPQRKSPVLKAPLHKLTSTDKNEPSDRSFWSWLRSLGQRTARSIDTYDKHLFESLCTCEIKCGHLYIQSLRYRPHFWIYKCCPSIYPSFLRWYYCSKTCFYHCTFSISLCFWTPVAFCCYLWYRLCLCCCQ